MFFQTEQSPIENAPASTVAPRHEVEDTEVIDFRAAFKRAQKDCEGASHLTRFKGEIFFDIDAVKNRCWDVASRKSLNRITGEKVINDERRALSALAKPLYMIAAADSRCPVIVEGERYEGGRLETLFGNVNQNIGTIDRIAVMYALVRKVVYENLNPKSVIVTITQPFPDPPIKKNN